MANASSGKATLVEHEGLLARGSSPAIPARLAHGTIAPPVQSQSRFATLEEQKAHERARFDALWTAYNASASADESSAASDDDDWFAIDRDAQLRTQVAQLEGFIAFLRVGDEADVSTAIAKATELAQAARQRMMAHA